VLKMVMSRWVILTGWKEALVVISWTVRSWRFDPSGGLVCLGRFGLCGGLLFGVGVLYVIRVLNIGEGVIVSCLGSLEWVFCSISIICIWLLWILLCVCCGFW